MRGKHPAWMQNDSNVTSWRLEFYCAHKIPNKLHTKSSARLHHSLPIRDMLLWNTFLSVMLLTVLSLPAVLQNLKVHIHSCVSVLAQTVKATFDALICPPHSMDTFATCVLDKKPWHTENTTYHAWTKTRFTLMQHNRLLCKFEQSAQSKHKKDGNKQKILIKHIYS